MTTSENASPKVFASVFDLASKSLQLVKNNWQLFALVNVISILSAVSTGIQGDQKTETNQSFSQMLDSLGVVPGSEWAADAGVGVIYLIVFALICLFLYAMATSLELRASKGEKPTFDTLFAAGKKYWARLFLLLVLSGLIVLGGLVLLIVPGIIAIGRLIFAPYVMVDRDLGVLDSIKASNEMAKGRAGAVWSVIGFMILISIGAGILGAIPLIGALAGTAIVIAYSLVIPLRYIELKKA